MKNIDKLIKNSFKNEKMPEGHQNRFMAKLNVMNKNTEPKTVRSLAKSKAKKLRLAIITAAAVVLFIVGFQYNNTPFVSEVICDEVCKFLSYTDNELKFKEDEVLTIALEKLPAEEYNKLKINLEKMISDYENSKLQQSFMSDNDFIYLMNTIHNTQLNSLNNIVTILKS